MTKQLHALPDLDKKQPRPKFVTVPTKYSAQKKHLTYLAAPQGETTTGQTPRSMDTTGDAQGGAGGGGHVTVVDPPSPHQRSRVVEGQRSLVPPARARREDSRLADLGDENTPRIAHEDRTKAESAMLPPIEALAPIADTEEEKNGPASPQPEPKAALKLPVASRYQLYSIGLTYNANNGKDKKDRRSKKKPQTYREINSRRMKMKGSSYRDEVPDIAPASKPSPEHEQFSIRKKIDQYRNWHEEQYKQKLRDLKTDVEKEKQAEILKIAALKNKSKKPAIKMAHRASSSDHLPRLPIKSEHNVPAALPEVDEDVVSQHDVPLKVDSPGKENDPKESKDNQRLSSAKTWKTWRDVNDSYAYTDVKQYIKDNELMDDEKEKYINEWIEQVGDSYSFQAESETKSHTTLRSGRDV